MGTLARAFVLITIVAPGLAAALSTLACAADPQSLPTALHDPTNPSGIRSALEQQGVQFTFSYYGDAFANPAGGLKRGPGYDARFGTIVDADLNKLIGWRGATFHASFHDIFGTQFSTDHLANLMSVSGIEAPPSIRLFNLWIEQKIGNDLTLRLGQFTAAQEFMTSENATLFVNSTFGWPMPYAEDLPSGGPNYPEATPGARLSWASSDHLTFQAAVFNGDPAGSGPGNPVQRDPLGIAFRVNDPPFFMFEGAFGWGAKEPASQGNPRQEGTGIGGARWRQGTEGLLPGTFKLGAWIHTGAFANQRLDAAGGSLAASGGLPLQHRGNFAIYAILDQQLWELSDEADRGLSGFLRVSFSPSDRNPVNIYADGGLTFKGPFAARPDDLTGLSLAWGRISPAARAFDRELSAISRQPIPIRDYELAMELTYQFKLADNWIIQPNLQYIVHPGGHVPFPVTESNISGRTNSAIPNAFVAGVRTVVKF